MAFLSYEGTRHVTIGYTPADGVAIINLRSRPAGEIDGVRVGDSLAAVVRRWGRPHIRQGHVAGYSSGWWVVALYLDDADATIRMLGLGRIAN
jgi:hypothetical protein